MLTKERDQRLHLMRGWAILGVVLTHVTASTYEDITSNFSLLNIYELSANQLSRFSVPIFLILSGIGLTLSKKYEEPYVRFMYSRIRKLILPYISWTVVYFVLNRDYRLLTLLKNIFLANAAPQLYYIPLLLLLYLVYPVIRKIVTEYKLGIWVLLLVTIGSQLLFFITGNDLLQRWPMFTNWIFYLGFGIWSTPLLSKMMTYNKLKVAIAACLSGVIIIISTILLSSFIEPGIASTTQKPTIILYSVLTFFLLLRTVKRSALIELLSNYSFQIYLNHMVFLKLFYFLLPAIGLEVDSFVYQILAFLLIMGCSILFAKLVEKIKFKMNKKIA